LDGKLSALARLQLLVLMGGVMGKLSMAWDTADAVVGFHGQSDGKAANGLVNGQSGCWLLVFMGRVMGKLPIARETGQAVVSSRGP